MGMGGEEEDVRSVIEGWKSGEEGVGVGKSVKKKRRVAKLGKRERGRIVLEFLVGEKKAREEEIVKKEKEKEEKKTAALAAVVVEEPKVEGEVKMEGASSEEEKVEPSVVETPLEVKEEEKIEVAPVAVVEDPKENKDEPMEEEVKVDEAEAARIREAKGKGKVKGVEMGQLAFAVESREAEKYSVWVFLQGYLEAKEVEKTDIRTFVKPLVSLSSLYFSSSRPPVRGTHRSFFLCLFSARIHSKRNHLHPSCRQTTRSPPSSQVRKTSQETQARSFRSSLFETPPRRSSHPNHPRSLLLRRLLLPLQRHRGRRRPTQSRRAACEDGQVRGSVAQGQGAAASQGVEVDGEERAEEVPSCSCGSQACSEREGEEDPGCEEEEDGGGCVDRCECRVEIRDLRGVGKGSGRS